MNPFSPYSQLSRSKAFRTFLAFRVHKRSTKQFVHRAARRKESYGAVEPKRKLSCSLLNVNGLTEESLADVSDVLARKKSDVCVIL